MLSPDEVTKKFHNLSVTGASGMPVMTKCCALACLPGDQEDDEPGIEVTLSSQIKMGSSSSFNFLSSLETRTGTKEVVVLLSLKVLKIKDPRNLHWFLLWIHFEQESKLEDLLNPVLELITPWVQKWWKTEFHSGRQEDFYRGIMSVGFQNQFCGVIRVKHKSLNSYSIIRIFLFSITVFKTTLSKRNLFNLHIAEEWYQQDIIHHLHKIQWNLSNPHLESTKEKHFTRLLEAHPPFPEN